MAQVHQLPSTRPIIALLTDFGSGDGNVGVMKGVVLSITPDVQLIDITHDVTPQNIASGAWILATSYRYFPRGTVYVCVVDPGVGSTRLPIAVHAGDWFFVGPDNGLFSYVYVQQTVHTAVRLSNSTYHLAQVSATFHGRDIFSPAGAHIARGVPLSELGQQFDPATLQRIAIAFPTRQGNSISGQILYVDHFGNLITDIPLNSVPDLFSCAQAKLIFHEPEVTLFERRRFFSEGAVTNDAAPFIYNDSSGYVGVAVYNGSAARQLGVDYGAAITLVLVE